MHREALFKVVFNIYYGKWKSRAAYNKQADRQPAMAIVAVAIAIHTKQNHCQTHKPNTYCSIGKITVRFYCVRFWLLYGFVEDGLNTHTLAQNERNSVRGSQRDTDSLLWIHGECVWSKCYRAFGFGRGWLCMCTFALLAILSIDKHSLTHSISPNRTSSIAPHYTILHSYNAR